MPWDRSKYPAHWEQLVAQVAARAGGRCECQGECGDLTCKPRCEALNKQPHPITKGKVTLTTAHLDHNTANNEVANLKHLCNRCHLKLDANQHIVNARATRVRRREDAGQMRLDGGKP